MADSPHFGGARSDLWSSDAAGFGVLHHVKHGTVREQVSAPKCAMLSAKFNQGGNIFCTASSDKTARVYEVTTRKQIVKMKHPEWVRYSNFSADGTLVCTACDDADVRVFNAETGEQLRNFQQRSWATSANFSPDGRLLCASSRDKMARVYALDAEEGVEPLLHKLEHKDMVQFCDFTNDGTRVCTGSGATRFFGLARIFSIETGQEQASFEHGDVVTSMNFNQADQLLTTSSLDGNTRIFDVRSQDEVGWFKHGNWVLSASFSLDSRFVCTACSDGAARIFDFGKRKELQCFRHMDSVTSASFSRDVLQLITSSSDGSVRIWGATS